MQDNEITNLIIGSTIEVHKALGPGLLESAYQECLYYELKANGQKLEKKLPFPSFIKK